MTNIQVVEKKSNIEEENDGTNVGGGTAKCPRRPLKSLMASLAFFVAASCGGSVFAEEPIKLKSLTPLDLGERGQITFSPGLRVQARYVNDGATGNNDFRDHRIRLKGRGEVFGLLKYYTEVKFDGQGGTGEDSSAAIENGYLQFPVVMANIPDLNVRIGLYDIPVSRNSLTSDSKLLVMNRSEIRNELARIGMADNTVGVLFFGRPFGGHFEYNVGIFDNEDFDEGDTGTRDSDYLMPAGRFVFHLLDPAKPGGYADYRGSYVGRGAPRLALGFNSAYLGEARDSTGMTPVMYDLYAFGADVFFSTGPFSFEAEYDQWQKRDMSAGMPDVYGDGWYVQSGLILNDFLPAVGNLGSLSPLEFAVRYQENKPDKSLQGNRIRWTTLGFNYYIRDHYLKVQADYTIKDEQGTEIDNDLVQLQVQLDW